MISKELAIEINRLVVKESGGSSGLRDESLLLSAINRPFQTFDGKDLYPTIVEKSAAIFESIIINHPFIDGNKRVAYAMMKMLLIEEGFQLNSTKEETYNFVIETSKGNLRFNEIKDWLIEKLI